jgi:hypothetical protein
MAECSQLGFELPSSNGRKIEGNFEGECLITVRDFGAYLPVARAVC